MKHRSTIALLLFMTIASCLGCTRGFYRQQADNDAYNLIAQKSHDPRWDLGQYTIEIDPRSRMYDPFDADHEPMPPDDPTAHHLMHCVDCKKGAPCWHKFGDTNLIENRDYLAYLPWSDDGKKVVISRDEAIRIARLNSRSYQGELEDLYLSALDVSYERFRFDAQFFGGYDATYTADGRERSGSDVDTSELDLSTGPSGSWQVSKLFPTGAELVVGMANSLVWQFSGPDDYSGVTFLDFALVQPLLRLGGRARVMEGLTFSERSLLANVRSMERFQREFYVNIIAGRSTVSGPIRTGASLAGFNLGPGTITAGGYFGLLQDQLRIGNQKVNVSALQGSVAQLKAFYDADRIDRFQLELALQAQNNAQSRLLTSEASYRSSLDTYKLSLGIATDQEIVIQDDFLDQFILIDTAIIPVRDKLTLMQDNIGQKITSLLPREDELPPAPPAAWSKKLETTLTYILDELKDAETLRKQVVTTNLPRAKKDLDKFIKIVPIRSKQFKAHEKRLYPSAELEDVEVDATVPGGPVAAEATDPVPDRIEDRENELTGRLVVVTESLDGRKAEIAKHIANLEELIAAGPTLAPKELQTRQMLVLAAVPTQITDLANDVLELMLIQAGARTETITLVPVNLKSRVAVEVARENRLDWMNARAALVDTWRLIEFDANDLESGLDLVFSGDIGNVGDNPANLRDVNGRLRVGVEFDAPVTRLSERNTYRESLIEYQQARRDYYAIEDGIKRNLRETLRTLNLNRENFELRREAVHIAINQVTLSQLSLQKPPKPGETNRFGSTTARNLVSALNALLNAQNEFLAVWVNYEILRRILDLDMGTMQIDHDGIWIDPGPITLEQFNTPPIGELLDDIEPLPVQPMSHQQPLISRLMPENKGNERNLVAPAVFHPAGPIAPKSLQPQPNVSLRRSLRR